MESILLTLAVLACPAGMGLMMWFMANGMRKDGAPAAPQNAGIVQLRSDVEALRERQQALAAEPDRRTRAAAASPELDVSL